MAGVVGAAFIARVVGVIALRQALMADAQGQQHLVVQERHGVAQGVAAHPRTSLQGRVVNIVAAQCSRAKGRLVVGDRVVDIRREGVPEIHDVGVLLLQIEEGRRRHDLVADRAGTHFGAQAEFARVDAVFAGVVEAVEITRAGAAIRQRHVAQRVRFVAAAKAIRCPASQLVAEVVFRAHGAEHIALIRIRPRLRVVGTCVRGVGHGGHARAHRHVRPRALQLVFLPADVRRQARVRRAPIQAQGHQAGARMFVVNRRVAAALRGVQADAGAVVRAEAAGDVGRDLELAAAGNAGGDAGQRLVRRALGHQVDHAADAAAAGRGARQESGCAAQHFHALEQFGGDVLARQQAVQAVVGHVVRTEDEAANEIGLLEITEAARHAHARIVLQDIAHAASLLVLDQFVRVAGDAERRAQVVQRAQHAHTAAGGHLPARERRGQAAGGCVGAGLYLDGLHRHHRAAVRGRLRWDRGGGLRMDDAHAWQRRGHASESSNFHIGIKRGRWGELSREKTHNPDWVTHGKRLISGHYRKSLASGPDRARSPRGS
ncbi:hypothetical protein D3C86_1027760 [compost metagenome]